MIHDPVQLDPTEIFPRPPRTHDEVGRIDPDFRAIAQAADALINQARYLSEIFQARELAIRPIELLAEIEKLDALVIAFDRVKAKAEKK